MATLEDVRRIASQLPGAIEGGEDRFGYSVMVKGKAKGFVWSWMERVTPKKPKEENRGVLAISTPNVQGKEMLLAERCAYFVHDDHYNGYPAVLVRLEDIPVEDLENLLIEAWRSKAPKDALKAYDEG